MKLRAVLIGFAAWPLLGQTASAQDWIKLENDDFVVYSALSEDKSKAALKRVMLTDYVLKALTGTAMNKAHEAPLKIILPKNDKDIQTVLPGISSNVVGVYLRHPSDTFFISPGLGTKNADFLKRANEILGHEYTHHFQHNMFADGYPRWFTEGLASYVGPTKQDPETLTLGWPSIAHVTGLTNSKAWVEPQKLFNADFYKNSAESRSHHYDVSWLTVHYMMATDARKAKLFPILKAYDDDGKISNEEFKAIMGMSFKEFGSELKSYFRGKALTWSTPTPNVSLDNVKITPLSEGDSKAFLAHQSIRVASGIPKKQRPKILKRISKLADKYPDSYNAQYALAGYHAAFSPPQKALQFTQDFKQKFPNTADGQLMSSDIHMRSYHLSGKANGAKSKDISRLDKARPFLEKAIALDPDMYRAHFSMAVYLQIKKAPAKEVTPYLERAHALAPQVDEITFQLGRNYVKSANTKAGVALIERVAQNPHGGRTSQKAKTFLKKMQSRAPSP